MHTKTKRAIKDFSSKEDNEFHKLTEVVFSSALSLFLTYLAETYLAPDETEPLKILDIAALFVGGILLYCALYICIRKVYSIISKKIEDRRYNKQINSPDVSAQKNKELIDDFDHIAFDNLIVAWQIRKDEYCDMFPIPKGSHWVLTVFYIRPANACETHNFVPRPYNNPICLYLSKQACRFGNLFPH